MTRQKWVLSSAAAIALMATTTAQASIITTQTQNASSINLMSGTGTPGGTVLTTFDSVTPGNQPPGFTPATGTTPGGGVVGGGNSSLYAAPLGDNTQFYAVAYNPPTGPLVPASDTLTLGSPENYFGLYWGSIDTYNTLTFKLGGVTLVGGSFTGANFGPANGNQTAANTNEYIDFSFTGGQTYDQVVFSTSQINFEFDNVRIGDPANAVPEPASFALFGTALLGFGFIRRRRKRS